MSKYINGIKGSQLMTTYKSTHQRLREAKAKLAEAQAKGDAAGVRLYTTLVNTYKLRFTRKPQA